jgi:hypothetical protein
MQDLASQPTLSRFENAISIADLNRIRELFVTLFIQSFEVSLGGTPPERITLDFGAWDDATHGPQQLTLERSFPARPTTNTPTVANPIGTRVGMTSQGAHLDVFGVDLVARQTGASALGLRPVSRKANSLSASILRMPIAGYRRST